jgi:hypothetical protein
VKVKLVGPDSGYVPGGYRRWDADEIIEVDDADEAAVAGWRAHCVRGGGTVMEDAHAKPEPSKAAVESAPRRGRPPLPRDSQGNVVRT